jgi:hypothetical protein
MTTFRKRAGKFSVQLRYALPFFVSVGGAVAESSLHLLPNDTSSVPEQADIRFFYRTFVDNAKISSVDF